MMLTVSSSSYGFLCVVPKANFFGLIVYPGKHTEQSTVLYPIKTASEDYKKILTLISLIRMVLHPSFLPFFFPSLSPSLSVSPYPSHCFLIFFLSLCLVGFVAGDLSD